MSNSNDKTNLNANSNATSNPSTVSTNSNRKSDDSKKTRWSFIQTDLKDALNTWEDLEKSDLGLSPEEEQLKKIKSIIGQLKEKLEQF